MTGRIFDVKEMALHDGSGVRVTVFLKGCPLRCEWCHNPEGLKKQKQLLYKKVRCTHCGLCRAGCDHEECKPYGRCLHVCPNDCLLECGQDVESSVLVDRLCRYVPIFRLCGGGVTFSGGKPLMQAEFVLQTIQALRQRGVEHIAIETCAYAEPNVFQEVARACDEVIMDVKIFGREEHKKRTGVYNDIIKENYLWLKTSGISHVVRTPLIAGKTDGEENLRQIEEFVKGSVWEKLPENNLAQAKYENLTD
jgi:pyruvate formate lyase activating enzyme